jgi:hypothetical protein
MSTIAEENAKKISRRFEKGCRTESIYIFKAIAEKILEEHYNQREEIMSKYPKGNAQMSAEIAIIDEKLSEQLHLEKLLNAWRSGQLNGNGSISRRKLRKELIDLLEKHEPVNVQKLKNRSFQKARSKVSYPFWKAIDIMQKEPFKDYDIEEIWGKCDNIICKTKESIKDTFRNEEQFARERMEKAGLYVLGVEKRQTDNSKVAEKPNGVRGFFGRFESNGGGRDR